MDQTKRILIAMLIIAVVGMGVLGIDWLRRQSATVPAALSTPASGTLAASTLAISAVAQPVPPADGSATPALGSDAIATGAPAAGPFAVTPLAGERIVAGGIPLYYQGTLFAAFTPADLEGLTKASFIDPVENKPQEGWLVSEILLLYFTPEQLLPDTPITFTSNSRQKSATLTWAEVSDPDGFVMFDVSNRGTLKLVSQLEKLDEREEWVQDTEVIEVGAGRNSMKQPYFSTFQLILLAFFRRSGRRRQDLARKPPCRCQVTLACFGWRSLSLPARSSPGPAQPAWSVSLLVYWHPSWVWVMKAP